MSWPYEIVPATFGTVDVSFLLPELLTHNMAYSCYLKKHVMRKCLTEDHPGTVLTEYAHNLPC